MRIVSSIFSWIGGVATMIVGFVRLSIGYEADVIYYVDGLYPVKTGATKIKPYDTWVWILWFVYLGGMLAILIWREISTRQGSKILFGIFSLGSLNLPSCFSLLKVQKNLLVIHEKESSQEWFFHITEFIEKSSKESFLEKEMSSPFQ